VDLWVTWLLLPVPSAALLLAPPPPLPETQQPPSIDHLLPSSFFAPYLEPLFSLQQNQMNTNTELSLFSSFVFKTTTADIATRRKKLQKRDTESSRKKKNHPKKHIIQKPRIYSKGTSQTINPTFVLKTNKQPTLSISHLH
jgi:hypothetical protein